MTDRVEGEDNSIMLHDFLCDGYDVKVTLDHSDPMAPSASVHTGDIIGTTQEFLGRLYNDNMLRITDYTAVPQPFPLPRHSCTLLHGLCKRCRPFWVLMSL